ncbi:DUF2971 domain-containing protein [Chitinilyticum litopenaei]|uniref:DUF2971 domain-containing protein n=1 Tax=Chitinilyticum litopenaei TaxID=1121276 RepID=UPI00130EE813|nr:tetratricopeptide repeat protein [Chitinilyticum litopenaei]
MNDTAQPTPSPHEQAEALFQQALALDHDGASPTDLAEAAKLYEQAAELGHPAAMFNLALMHQSGQLGKPNYRKAEEFYKQAIKQGHAASMFNLASLYHDGRLGEPDYIQAAKLYELAIEQNLPEAMVGIAFMYIRGELGKPDYPKAEERLLQAIDLGNTLAMLNLALLYKSGALGDKRLDKAQYWFAKAHEAGDPHAHLYFSNQLISDTGNQLQQAGVTQELCSELQDALDKLEFVFFTIREEHRVKKAIPLSHFTRWEAIESILSVDPNGQPKPGGNCLRQYHVDYMNDPTEGRRLLEVKPKAVALEEEHQTAKTSAKLKTLIDRHYHSQFDYCPDSISILPSVFVTSLTKESDRLDLWRAYGRDGDGFCLTFTPNMSEQDALRTMLSRANHEAFLSQSTNGDTQSRTPSEPAHDQPPPLYEIRYGDKEIAATLKRLAAPIERVEQLRDQLDNQALKNRVSSCMAAILLELLYLYKDEQYSTEKEVRALRVLHIGDPRIKADERHPGCLYCETPPFLFSSGKTEVIVGPKVAQPMAALWNIRWRLNKLGYARQASVRRSGVSYR